MQTKVLRAAVPALLIACVAIECWRGGDALPTWIANLSLKTGVGPDRALRIVLALQLAGAIVALAWERFVRPVCWAAGTAMAFSGLAELSAIVNAPGTAAVARSTWLAPPARPACSAAATAVSRVPARGVAEATDADRGRVDRHPTAGVP